MIKFINIYHQMPNEFEEVYCLYNTGEGLRMDKGHCCQSAHKPRKSKWIVEADGYIDNEIHDYEERRGVMEWAYIAPIEPPNE